jgi:signal transduction histidine kinase
MASKNLLDIVNGILDISKIEADKMEIVNTEYNLKEILDNLVKLIIPRIGEKDIELKTNFAVDLPEMLYGDSGKVKQIITNVLTNAAKYTDQGEINFNVDCITEKQICKLIITIKDTGRGIKAEQIDKLFNKFQRLDEDKNTTTEGTGLGLAITKRLVEMMGGKIVVQSEYGEGSTFTIYLTQEIANSIYKKEEIIEENITFDNKKVLLVDDNKLNIKVGTKILREYYLIVYYFPVSQKMISTT